MGVGCRRRFAQEEVCGADPRIGARRGCPVVHVVIAKGFPNPLARFAGSAGVELESGDAGAKVPRTGLDSVFPIGVHETDSRLHDELAGTGGRFQEAGLREIGAGTPADLVENRAGDRGQRVHSARPVELVDRL